MLTLLALLAFGAIVAKVIGVLVLVAMIYMLKDDWNNWPLIGSSVLVLGMLAGGLFGWAELTVACAIAYLWPLWKMRAINTVNDISDDINGR